MGFISRFLGSGLVSLFGNAILKPVLAHLQHKTDAEVEKLKVATGAEKEIALASLTATIQANAQRLALATEFRILVYAIALPYVLHSGAVMLDSTFAFGWSVPTAPGQFATYEREILLSFFVLQPTMTIAKGAARWLSR